MNRRNVLNLDTVQERRDDARGVFLPNRDTFSQLAPALITPPLAFSPNCFFLCSQALTEPPEGPSQSLLLTVSESLAHTILAQEFQQTQVQQTVCVQRNELTDQNKDTSIDSGRPLTVWRLRIFPNPPATHSSRMRTTSVRFSNTSCRATMLGCWICCRMSTSRSISSLLTPRRLARLCRFLMNLAAYSTPAILSLQRLTIANWPLWTQRRWRRCGFSSVMGVEHVYRGK